MFEARVAQFYRAKGYEVHEHPKVRGTSENVYSVAMVADGPLGALLVSFGDAGGVDAAEIGRVRTMARDIGATPVVASPTLSPDLRRLAAQMAVVVVDESTVADAGPLPRDLPTVAGDPLRRDMDAHPWPASGRAFSYGGPTVAAARDVDELVAELHTPRAPLPPTALTSRAAAAGWQALVAPQPPVASQAPVAQAATVPPASPATAAVLAPPAQATAQKFAWLGGGTALLQTQPPRQQGDVDLSALLGKAPAAAAASAAPALEHEATLDARTPLQKLRLQAAVGVDAARDWPWRTIAWATAGAALLVAIIRWLA